MRATPEADHSHLFHVRHARLLADASIALASVAFVLAWGPGDVATHDSAYYLNAAEHMARGHGYVTSSVSLGRPEPYEPMTLFAPLFPLLIALFIQAGSTARAAIGIVLGASFVAAHAPAFGSECTVGAQLT